MFFNQIAIVNLYFVGLFFCEPLYSSFLFGQQKVRNDEEWNVDSEIGGRNDEQWIEQDVMNLGREGHAAHIRVIYRDQQTNPCSIEAEQGNEVQRPLYRFEEQ